jgi:tetratricopeptide (TPR) repeat protein
VHLPAARSFRLALLALLAFATVAWWNANQPRYSPIAGYAFARAPAESFELIDPDEGKAPQTEAQLAGGPLAHPARRFDTFAHWVLDVESQATWVSPAKYDLLDSMIESVKSRIAYDPAPGNPRQERRQALHLLRTIDAVLTEHGVVYPPGDYDTTSLRLGLSPQHFDRATLDRLLRVPLNARRRDHARANPRGPFHVLDCDTASLVYLGIADGCGFGDHLHLVDLPDHMFVRWEFSDGSHLNWDTNDASIVEDREYSADYELSKNLRRRRVYLSSMTRDEAKGHVYFLRAGAYENRGDLASSIADMEKVLQLIPQSTQAKSDLAWLYATTRDVSPDKRRRAIQLAQAAIDLEPKCGDFWDTLAVAHAATGDFKQAVHCADKAVLYAPSSEDRSEYRSRRRAFEKGKMPSFEEH